MIEFKIASKQKKVIIALGAESAGNFSIYKDGIIHFSHDFGDLLIDENYQKFETSVLKFLKDENMVPDVILSDLHPLFRTTEFAKKLAKKYKAQHVPVQHHLAHVFSAIGDQIIEYGIWNQKQTFLGIACDGTGYGFDEKIWGGEVFKMQETSNMEHETKSMQTNRIGHLENQILLGGELAIKEPARILISILSKFQSKIQVYDVVKKYYSKNEFEVLWNQLGQNFNCTETSSTARILDAVSVLLEFSKNKSLEKHGPTKLLEKNSTKPYLDIKPKLERYEIQETSSKQHPISAFQNTKEMIVLNTTFLFEYLIKNIHKDKKRLAATAQKYIADGLLEIINNLQTTHHTLPTFFAGGMANNKIISKVLCGQEVYVNKKIPRGDTGISFGQIIYYLSMKS